ncbi:HYC_CC_PP family protein [Neolewinella litorea]|uniref:Uncharacterized protein n=1 Tax=Neolewinella litorea TaxID=2562452 RepID=A0A4S4NL47_9BACT|nr:hypothetical protein [Neolewinella litorea]THH39675.1 hypothetical protein E4021_08640 [Neolewinella litorea]
MNQILPLFLAFTMLVGSVGVTVNRHFCMGELKSLSLFGDEQPCDMAQVKVKAPVCPMHAAPAKKGCCDDEHEFVQWDDDRQLSETIPLPALAWALPATPPALFPEFALHLRDAALRRFQNYRPPPLVIDVPSRWQVFRL